LSCACAAKGAPAHNKSAVATAEAARGTAACRTASALRHSDCGPSSGV